jgi:hypothetical protein
MPRVSILLASLGLAFSVLLWSVPGLVAASGALQFVFPHDAPNLAERLQGQGQPSIMDALVGLMGAEAEAMQVAGVAIENPRTPRLAERADQASARVLAAVRTYIEVVRRALQR